MKRRVYVVLFARCIIVGSGRVEDKSRWIINETNVNNNLTAL